MLKTLFVGCWVMTGLYFCLNLLTYSYISKSMSCDFIHAEFKLHNKNLPSPVSPVWLTGCIDDPVGRKTVWKLTWRAKRLKTHTHSDRQFEGGKGGEGGNEGVGGNNYRHIEKV